MPEVGGRVVPTDRPAGKGAVMSEAMQCWEYGPGSTCADEQDDLCPFCKAKSSPTGLTKDVCERLREQFAKEREDG